MSWLRKFVSRTKEKIVMNILTRIVDAFKAKNPAAWSKIQTSLLLFQGLLITSITFSTELVGLRDIDGLLDMAPFLEGFFQFLENVPTALAATLSGVTYIIEKLIGSSTPGSHVPVRMLETQQVGKTTLAKGQIAFVKKKVAEELQNNQDAVKITVAK